MAFTNKEYLEKVPANCEETQTVQKKLQAEQHRLQAEQVRLFRELAEKVDSAGLKLIESSPGEILLIVRQPHR